MSAHRFGSNRFAKRSDQTKSPGNGDRGELSKETVYARQEGVSLSQLAGLILCG